MGYDATNILPFKTKIKDVEELLILLNYTRVRRDKIDSELKANSFWHFKEDNYSSFEGVQVSIYKRSDKKGINVDFHTRIWASKYDIDYLNYTIKQIKKYFGGHFNSDFGKNRYLKFDDYIRTNAEAGCFLAYQNFVSNISKTTYVAKLIKKNKFDFIKLPRLKMFWFLKEMDPNTLIPNLILPFLVAIMEEYFRSTYLALLKYSPIKIKILKRASLSEDDINRILLKNISIEEAACRWFNFQELEKVNKHFKEFDNKLDLFKEVKIRHGGKESQYNHLEKIIKFRHLIIHKSQLDNEYKISRSINDIRLIENVVKKFYHSLTIHYKWVYDPL